MLNLAAVILFTAVSASEPMVFLFEDDLVDPAGVSLRAQLPREETVLLPKDPERPKLWYAPVASEMTPRGARIWYQRVNSGEAELSDQRTLCVGEIRDGKWSPIICDSAPVAWGGVNNVCMRRSPFKPTWGGFNVFQIVKTAGEYRMVYWDQPSETGQAGAMLATSRDGLSWTKDPCGALFTEHNDAFTMLPRDEEYLIYQTKLEDWPEKPHSDNLDKMRRVQSLRRSRDLQQWTPQEVFLRPDAKDKPETEFYLMKAFRYRHGVLGLLMKYYADPALPGKHSAILCNELMVSRDGITWERSFRDTDVGFWSYADPFQHGDLLNFVIWKDGGMSIVSYPRNRLVAVAAGEEEGRFTTRAFKDPTLPLRIDANALDGWIEARLFDTQGKPIEGLESQRVENVDAPELPLTFGASQTPLRLSGEYCLQFRPKNAKIFAVVAGSGD